MAPRGPIPKSATGKQRMARKLSTRKGRAIYARRKAIVEPVFGQMSTLQNAKQLLLRGLDQARAEWLLLATCHNLRKLHGVVGVSGLAALARTPATQPVPQARTRRRTLDQLPAHPSLLLVRGVIVCDETIRQWCAKFGPEYARRLRRHRKRPTDKWHLDEVFLTINGRRQHLWRAVDQDRNVLDILVLCRRDAKAAS